MLLQLSLNRLVLASTTLTLLTLSFTPVFSQDRIENTSFAQAGDTIYFFTDDLPRRVRITASGPDQTWNYTNLNAPFLEYRIISPADRGQQADRYPEAELVAQSSDGDEMYIDVRDDGIWELGGKKGSRFDDQVVVNFAYKDGLPLQLSKMAYGQDLDYEDKMIEHCAIEDLPSYRRSILSTKLDSLRFSTNLSRNITVDAYGKLILPGARYEVIRARVEDYLSTHVEGKRANNSWSELSDSEVAKFKRPTRQVRYLFIRVTDGKLLAQVMTGVDGQPTRVEYTMPRALTRYFKPANPGQWMYAYPILHLLLYVSNLWTSYPVNIPSAFIIFSASR